MTLLVETIIAVNDHLAMFTFSQSLGCNPNTGQSNEMHVFIAECDASLADVKLNPGTGMLNVLCVTTYDLLAIGASGHHLGIQTLKNPPSEHPNIFLSNSVKCYFLTNFFHANINPMTLYKDFMCYFIIIK